MCYIGVTDVQIENLKKKTKRGLAFSFYSPGASF